MNMSIADTKGLISSKKGWPSKKLSEKMRVELSHRLDRICMAREEREDI